MKTDLEKLRVSQAELMQENGDLEDSIDLLEEQLNLQRAKRDLVHAKLRVLNRQVDEGRAPLTAIGPTLEGEEATDESLGRDTTSDRPNA